MNNGDDRKELLSGDSINNIPKEQENNAYKNLKNNYEDLKNKIDKMQTDLDKPITLLGLLKNNTLLFVSLIIFGFGSALFIFFNEREAVKQEVRFLRNQLPIELENRLNKRIDDTNHHIDEMLRNSKYNFSRGT